MLFIGPTNGLVLLIKVGLLVVGYHTYIKRVYGSWQRCYIIGGKYMKEQPLLTYVGSTLLGFGAVISGGLISTAVEQVLAFLLKH